MHKLIALVPARSGSKRLKDKNIKILKKQPLLVHTIKIAKKSNLFDKVFCVTDSQRYLDIAKKYGADDFPLRPKSVSGSKSPDLEWVKWVFDILKYKNFEFDIYSIMRPTSPFRTKRMLLESYKILKKTKAHSVRAVEKSQIHPGKIWKKKGQWIVPLINKKIGSVPWHSSQYANLPEFYAQNASLEMSWKYIFEKYNSISGKKISPLITKGYEGFDINTNLDFELAKLISKKIKI